MPPETAPTVSIMLARGSTHDQQSGKRDKALLSIRGRPMASYVLEALAESRLEKIFVVQSSTTHLEKAVPHSGKYVFLTCDEKADSLAYSLYFAIEKMGDHYGINELHRRRIMIVPCDIPLARAYHFDNIINLAQDVDFDIAFTIIARKQLEARYPGKPFHGLYFRDRKQYYVAQGIVFINGRILDVRAPGQPGGLRLVVEGWDERMTRGMEETIDSIRQQRRRGYLWMPFAREFLVRRLTYHGLWRTVLCLARDMTLRRVTLARVQHYLVNSFGLRVAFLESHEAEISGDIDEAADLLAILGKESLSSPCVNGTTDEK